ncbi:MopE-related protein [Sorangium sp. So ce233]|uniref:MopE-related protein n=1 Tax=Sorangium sp. So ce233 TaxID=3133290 RepID=UPI003F5F8A7A
MAALSQVVASPGRGRWAAILLGVAAGCTPNNDGNADVGGSGGSGGDTSLSSSGSGGDGGSGGQGGGEALCLPGSRVACPYSGPPGTQGVGRCTAGLRTCNESGTAYGPCEGEVLPAPEDCSVADDEDCDGVADGGDADCVCVPGTEVICYSGDRDTLGVGPCEAGTARCRDDGSGFGPCVGEVLPAAETCLTPVDDDCDGQANEEGAGCACVPGELVACYAGPPGTEGVGRCAGGMARCQPDGIQLGPCEGDALPEPETCLTPIDDDCDGEVNEEGASCVCPPSQRVSCYSGPPGTADVGVCASGTALCDAQGTSVGPCEGEALPQPESCATPVDDDCDGEVNEGGTGCAAGITARWAKRFSGISISAVAVDAFDNTIIAGSFRSPVDLGTGPLVPRTSDPEAFVAKLDPSGEVLFATTLEGDDGAAHDIATDASGNIALLAWFTESVDTGGHREPYFVYYHRIVKLDPSGGFLWNTDFIADYRDSDGTEYRESDNAVAMNAAGDVFVVGASREPFLGSGDGFVRKLDSATGALAWQKIVGDHRDDEIRFDDVATRENGEIVTVGRAIFIEYVPRDVREGCAELMTLSPAGEELDRTCVGTGEETWQLALDASGNAVLGSTVYPDQGRVSQLDGASTSVWSREISPVQRMRLAVDGLGNVVVAGSFTGTLGLGGSGLTSSGGTDMYLARLDPDGNVVFSESYGGAGHDSLMHLAVSAEGAAVIAGDFEGAITFGESTLVAETARDVFLAKVSF